MIHETGVCPLHGFKLVSMPRDPDEPNQTHYHGKLIAVAGARDDKGFTFKCPLEECLMGIPKGIER